MFYQCSVDGSFDPTDDSLSIGSEQSFSIYDSSRTWSASSTVRQIPVCWVDVGNDSFKRNVKGWVTNSWERYANVKFTGWNRCYGSQGVQIGINSGNYGFSQTGSDSRGSQPSMMFSDQGRTKFIALYEFGHALGFHHEQNRDDSTCNPPNKVEQHEGYSDRVYHGDYDSDSIMNYCREDQNAPDQELSLGDIEAVQSIYGINQNAYRNFRVRNAKLTYQTPYRGLSCLDDDQKITTGDTEYCVVGREDLPVRLDAIQEDINSNGNCPNKTISDNGHCFVDAMSGHASDSGFYFIDNGKFYVEPPWRCPSNTVRQNVDGEDTCFVAEQIDGEDFIFSEPNANGIVELYVPQLPAIELADLIYVC